MVVCLVCLFVSPVMNWRSDHTVFCVLYNDSWERLQTLPVAMPRMKWIYKMMDGSIEPWTHTHLK